MFDTLRRAVVGRRVIFEGPFGPRMLTYADHTASGRAVDFIEDYLRHTALVEYGNTHTEDSYTGRRTTLRAEEAAAMVKAGVGADERDVVLFCGTGSTGAIARFQEILRLKIAPGADKAKARAAVGLDERPLVIVGPYEHHSNEISWRETLAEVVECPMDEAGLISHAALDGILSAARAASPRRQIIGAFSAASNVTGVLTEVHALARIFHEYGALACFDFAASAPYVPINMHPPALVEALDAIFISPHKMLGGPGTPGVLVFRRDLYTLKAPTTAGGGTVRYVSTLGHVYTDDISQREEAGTPGIIQKLRCGLVFALKDKLGAQAIASREQRWLKRGYARLAAHPGVELLRPACGRPCLPILSFNIKAGDRYLHHRFVTALLNDLFGVQSRAGCSCAGPYGHRLLGINEATSSRYCQVILGGYEGLKPGWVRVGLHYIMSAEEVDFLIDAILFVADHGARFLGLYDFDVHGGGWRHREAVAEAKPLLDLEAAIAGIGPPTRARSPREARAAYLAEAHAMAARLTPPPPRPCLIPEEARDLIFFVL
ncbi:aminotransferase class V-fold PLP-dependent enzyme [Myxococcota bacterium]|nr:aminotransferase class V-fold PLP-dependent enzyme [Myxococcota bacterium]MBU1431538.1 aminotransferase class V-fold PLP-dependent enzyme [Myxococcota bacterium]MBU1899952.1 aminotransferase class V-fold PLP-dependent enzyme [Myxococcota bacterium]